MSAYKNMFVPAAMMMLTLLFCYSMITYWVGFQVSDLSRGLASMSQIGTLTVYIWVLLRKNPEIENKMILRHGILFAFATAVFKITYLLVFDALDVFPLISMVYEGYAETLITKLESIQDLVVANQVVKSGLSPTFLLIFVFLGTFITGATASFIFYLVNKTKSKWTSH